MNTARIRVGCLVAMLGLGSFAVAQSADDIVNDLGRIDFPNSGPPEAQDAFMRGVLLLHSFEYSDAAESFREAQEIAPDFALAFWGEALTHSHFIWHEDDPAQARAVLRRLAPSREERLVLAPSERERGILDSVESLYTEGVSRPERNLLYRAALERLHERFPDDLEIATFYSVSILGTSENGRHVPTYMLAGAVAEEVFMQNPAHPGALHYAIHSYDDPVHAPLGLRMARRYAKIAPAAAHALHMPSHIFVALGMWDESVSSNIDSSHAADMRRERKKLSLDARGYHSLQWLQYSLLQLGRVEEARALLEDMVNDAGEHVSSRTRSGLAAMKTMFLVDAGELIGDAPEIDVDASGLSLSRMSAYWFSLGLLASRAGRVDEALEALETMRTRRIGIASGEVAADVEVSCCRPFSAIEFKGLTPDEQAAVIMETQLAGMILIAQGETDEGVELVVAAAIDENAMGYDFGPPSVVKPAHELAGEVLLETDPAGAVLEFEAALRRAPRRAPSLLGLARALAASGESERAQATYAKLAAIWHGADTSHPALAEIRGGSSD